MKIHEYQTKQLLKKYGVSVPIGVVIDASEQAEQAVSQIGGQVFVVKAQIHAGGRGKAGGVQIAKSLEEVSSKASALLGETLVTHQTGEQGQVIHQVLIEEGLDILKEFYFSILIDPASRQIIALASTEGGMDIEEVAENTPQKILKEPINLEQGLLPFQARRLAYNLGLADYGKSVVSQAVKFFQAAYRAFVAEDSSMLEVNPLVVTQNERLLALDGKMQFDDNALYRHSEIASLRDLRQENPTETEANEQGLSFIKLDGNIGCMVNGAGLAMATMDLIHHFGGQPANFLDIGGTANQPRVEAAFKILSEDPNTRCIMVNIFGGIVRCDLIAKALVAAMEKLGLHLPIVVRLQGTNEAEAKKIIEQALDNQNIIFMDDLAEAARKAVELSQI